MENYVSELPSISALKKFLHELLPSLPGQELGENVIEFQNFIKSIGLGNIIYLDERGNVSLKSSALSSLNMPETVRKILVYLGNQMEPNLSDPYRELFIKNYLEFRSGSQPAAEIWLNQMLHDHGGLLSAYGIIEKLPKDTKLPPIFQLLRPGSIHFLKEEKPEQGYAMIREAIKYAFKGFCVSKLEPNKVRYRYGVKNAQIIWLTFNKTKEKSISPDDLDGLKSLISKADIGSVILFDCLNEIKLVNGFKEALELFKELKKLCREGRLILIVSVDPKKLAEKQLLALEQAMEVNEK
ncbi:MAG: DUF835 domain-containing protein [Candidatus Hadarchaeum sp.]|uniref:DUF835 domain-containing protein n=1 Tax=Candidatus Hadarchaeum sp. TaxID=2883567 RepID=UPI003D0C8D54